MQGVCLMALNRYGDAISCSDQILRIYPHNADALNNRGVCLMALERYAEAIDCFEKAMKLNPTVISIHNFNNKANKPILTFKFWQIGHRYFYQQRLCIDGPREVFFFFFSFIFLFCFHFPKCVCVCVCLRFMSLIND